MKNTVPVTHNSCSLCHHCQVLNGTSEVTRLVSGFPVGQGPEFRQLHNEVQGSSSKRELSGSMREQKDLGFNGVEL